MSVDTKKAPKKPAKKRKTTPKKPHKTVMPADLVARLAEGQTYTQIAKDLNVRPATVCGWAALPEVQQQVGDLQREASVSALQRLASLQGSAVDAVRSVLDRGPKCKVCGRGPSKATDKDRLKAVEIVFDRTGMPKTERQELAGNLGLSAADDASADREILTEAARILQARGLTELAEQVRAHA